MEFASIYDQLALIGQVSATLLGFVAIFLVLSRADGRFSESDQHFIVAFILTGSYAFVLALAPSALSHFVSAGALWSTALWIGFVVGGGSAVYQAYKQYTMPAEEAAKIHWGWHVIAWGMAAFMSALIILGLLGTIDPPGAYVGAATVSVILALWSFISVVFRSFF